MDATKYTQAAQAAEALIRRIIAECGPREAGSAAERKAQDIVAEELAPVTDSVEIEPFAVYPQAFLGFMRVTAVLMIGASLAYWFAPLVGVFLTGAGFVIALLQFLFYQPFLDPFYPKRTSHNLIGVRKATGEVKRRIILSGHIDSAYEWPLSYHYGAWMVKATLIGAILGVLVVAGCAVARLIGEGVLPGLPQGVWLLVGIAQTVPILWFIGLYFFVDFNTVVPGANDNLTGVAASLAVAKLLHEAGERYGNTEVVILSMGSEEAGLRGAKAYAERHNARLKEVPTAFIALETFRDIEHMAIYSRDMSGVVRNHPGLCALVKEAGQRCGKELHFETIYAGASDAAAFSQAGIPAAALAAMDPAPPRYYHTRFDDVDNMDPACIELAIRIAVETVRLFDQQGIPQEGH
jgi:hypothetical protein